MGYKNLINNLKPIDYSKYKDITSYEKLMLYVALVLENKKIPLTFNYLCISAFKLFPDVFCCDNEFKEFPSVDRLNRTIMHLKYVKVKPFLTGTVESGYSLTNLGKSVAIEVESIIKNTNIEDKVKAPMIDTHKKGFSKDYIEFVSSDSYKKYLEANEIDVMYIWEFFKVTPYTQLKTTKDNLENILNYAKEKNDNKCIEYIEKILKII